MQMVILQLHLLLLLQVMVVQFKENRTLILQQELQQKVLLELHLSTTIILQFLLVVVFRSLTLK
jgi:hypothetical protein